MNAILSFNLGSNCKCFFWILKMSSFGKKKKISLVCAFWQLVFFSQKSRLSNIRNLRRRKRWRQLSESSEELSDLSEASDLSEGNLLITFLAAFFVISRNIFTLDSATNLFFILLQAMKVGRIKSFPVTLTMML